MVEAAGVELEPFCGRLSPQAKSRAKRKNAGANPVEVKYGGGGGSRTRVRNPCQQRDSMRSRVPEISRHALRTDKMRVTLVR